MLVAVDTVGPAIPVAATRYVSAGTAVAVEDRGTVHDDGAFVHGVD